ncbi:MAG: hypothetical protein ACTIDE_16300 [Carnobacterium maltaromaticum]
MKKFTFAGIIFAGIMLMSTGTNADAAVIENEVAPELTNIYFDDSIDTDSIIITTDFGTYGVENNELVKNDNALNEGLGNLTYGSHSLSLGNGQWGSYDYTIGGNSRVTFETRLVGTTWSQRYMQVRNINTNVVVATMDAWGTPAKTIYTNNSYGTYRFGIQNLSSSTTRYTVNISF